MLSRSAISVTVVGTGLGRPPAAQEVLLAYQALIMAFKLGLAAHDKAEAGGTLGVELAVDQRLDILRCNPAFSHQFALLLYLLPFLASLGSNAHFGTKVPPNLRPVSAVGRERKER